MIRVVAFLASAIVLGIVLVPALRGLPDVGHYPAPYGDVVVPISLDERRTTNVAATVAYDVRGFDTLGEEMILFAAVIGVALIVRGRSEMHREPEGIDRAEPLARANTSSRPAIRRSSACVLALGVVFGWYMVLHATQTPGGGFQGGAILASAVVLIYVAFGYAQWTRETAEHALDIVEAAGMLAFVAIAAVPLALGGRVVANWLPFGSLGELASGGTMFVMNIAIGLAVAAGFVAIVGSLLYDFHEAIEET